MMCNDRAPAFAHDCWVRDAFRITNVHNAPDDVISVFLERIICGAIEIAARTIVIDAKPAADIQISKLMPELRNLCVITGAFTHSPLDGRNVRYLRTDVEMDEFKTVPEASRLQHFARGNETCCIETELRVLAATRCPFSRAFAVKTHANSDVRFHPDFFCCTDCLLELFEFLGNDDHLLTELTTQQRDADEGCVFVAIANNETLGILVHRQRGDQFRLTSGFETKMKLLTGIDNFFNDFAQLINLDRKNTAILILVPELCHRL